MTSPNEYDPLADDKAPSMSFKDAPLGTVHHIDVTDVCKFLQQRDFDTDEPAYWPAKPGEAPNPKMAAVFNGVNEDGDPVSLWCPKPSDLFSKVADAQKTLGRRIGGGDQIDRLYVKLLDRVPAKNPKFNKNVFAVKVEQIGPKAQAAPTADPFSAPDADPWASTPAPASSSAAPWDDAPPY